MIGKKFGRLTVIGESKKTDKKKRIYYDCKCDCGQNTTVCGEKLRNGHTKSCGCLVKEKASLTHKKYNEWKIEDDKVIGLINDDLFFYVDIDDYELIKNYKWNIDKNGYVYARLEKDHTYLHRFVMNAKENEIVDHINHLTYDNRKSNLRIGLQTNNCMNASMRSNNISGFTGVWFNKERNVWMVEIKADKQKKYIGSFTNFDDAVEARKKAEEKYFNEWSFKNSTGVYNNEKRSK